MEGQLIGLYQKWHRQPKLYNEEMVSTIDRLIQDRLCRWSVKPIFHKFEDSADLKQELRLFVFEKVLPKVTDPTNKRLFNYISHSVDFYLRTRTRKVARRMTREASGFVSEVHLESIADDSDESFFHFGDKKLERFATLLSQKVPQATIRKELSLKPKEYSRMVEELKQIYAGYSE